MDKNNFENQLVKFFYKNPGISIDEVMDIVKNAKEKATKQVIPVYQVRHIDNNTLASDEYTLNTKVVKKEIYKDQSTFSQNLNY